MPLRAVRPEITMRNSLIQVRATVVAASLAQRQRKLSRLTIRGNSKPTV
jgi:hypothetical protein